MTTKTRLDFSPLSPTYWLGSNKGFASLAQFFDGINVPQEWINDKISQTSELIEEKRTELQQKFNKKMLELQEDAKDYLGELRNRGGIAISNGWEVTKTFVKNHKLFSLGCFGLLFGPTIGAIAFPM